MTRCHHCHRIIQGIPYICKRCGESFCSEHRLPEYHNCSGIKIGKKTGKKTGSGVWIPKPEPPYSPLSATQSFNSGQSRRPQKKNYVKLLFIVVIIGFGFFILLQYSAQIFYFSSSGKIDELMPIQSGVSSSSDPVYVPLGTQKTIKTPTITIPTTVRTPVPTTVNPSASFKNSPLVHSYPYYYNGAQRISFTTYGGLADYFSKEDHSYRYDVEKEVFLELLENPYQDEYLAPLLNALKSTSSNPDSQAKVAISMVQHMPYSWSEYYGVNTDWYYPYETLHRNKGVCAAKSFLLAYLLSKLGYDTVLFKFSNHMAVGVRSNPAYDFYDTGYAFIETTRPMIITYIPNTYMDGSQLSSNPSIIHLKNGLKKLDVSVESADAAEYKKLLSMGKMLDQYHSQRLSLLTTKYDLQYKV